MHLQTNGVSLYFSSDKNDWTTVTLHTEGTITKLGAETKTTLFERLRMGLEFKPLDISSGKIEGVEVSWILTLSEEFFTLYAVDSGSNRIFYLQNANAQLASSFKLDRITREQWLNKLKIN